METVFDYYKFRENRLIGKITTEIVFIEKNYDYCEDYPIKDYLDYLKVRIGIGQPEFKPQLNYRVAYGNNNNGLKTMVMDEYNKDMDADTFKRPWKKLREIHKVTKINEYIKTLPYEKKISEIEIESNHKYLLDELCKGLKTKCFTKDKSTVEYNEEEMIITSISCIEKTNMDLYKINWNL